MPTIRVYLAGPLFTSAERSFNQELAHAIEHSLPDARVILPQEYAKEIAGTGDFFEKMYNYCIDKITEVDAIVAVLDGADADSGTCIEIGYARAKDKPVVGIRTDFRASEEHGLNLMVSRTCTRLILETEWTPAADIARKIADAVTAVLSVTD